MAMINLEITQINVLSKMDLLPKDLPFRLDYFEELPDLKHLVDLLDVRFYYEILSKNCFAKYF